jgi:hypothetical protein
MGWPPRASIEGTDHMLVCGPSKPSSRLSIKAWLFPLLHWLLWERSWVWTHGSVSRCVVDCVGSPSSQGQWICSNLLMATWNVAIRGPREIRTVEGHTRTERGKRVARGSDFPLECVHRFESPCLLDMSTSYLWQSSRSNLMNLFRLM